MKIISLKQSGCLEQFDLPCDDGVIEFWDVDDPDNFERPVIAEELANEAASIIIYIPAHYDLDALLRQLNEIAKKPEHQPGLPQTIVVPLSKTVCS